MQSIILNIYLTKPSFYKILSIQSTSGCANDLPTAQILNARTKVAQLSRFDKLEFLWREDRSLRFPALANKLLQMHRLRVGFTITIKIISIPIHILIIISTIWPLATALDEGWVGFKGSCRALLGSGVQMKLRKGEKMRKKIQKIAIGSWGRGENEKKLQKIAIGSWGRGKNEKNYKKMQHWNSCCDRIFHSLLPLYQFIIFL